MPHVIVDYSSNIEELEEITLLKTINCGIFGSGLFKNVNDIKSRITKEQSYVVGLGDDKQAYLHVKLFILPGRTELEKQKLVTIISNILEQFDHYKTSDLEIQLCVEVNEIGMYQKIIKHH